MNQSKVKFLVRLLLKNGNTWDVSMEKESFFEFRDILASVLKKDQGVGVIYCVEQE